MPSAAQMNEAYAMMKKQLNDMAGKITFTLKSNGSYQPAGTVDALIDDHSFSHSEVEECEKESMSTEQVTSGSEHYELVAGDKHRFDVQVMVDEKALVAWVKLDSTVKTITKTVTQANGETKKRHVPGPQHADTVGTQFQT